MNGKECPRSALCAERAWGIIMTLDVELTHGIFRYEVKNRFRCIVEVEGKEYLCYVSSSSRLENFIDLKDREVLLLPAGEAAVATKYTLYAVKYKRGYILLELSLANSVIAEQLYRRYFSFLGRRRHVYREKRIEGYKADLYIEDTDTMIEIKTIISEKREAVFPSIHSDRALRQLNQLKHALRTGRQVFYLFVSLCPSVKVVCLDRNTEFYRAFAECMKLGMRYAACGLQTTKDGVSVAGLLPIR